MTKNNLKIITPTDMINWGDPQVLSIGAKDIVLYGNPSKAGDYVFRFKLPDNFEIKPFILSTTSFLTVLEGEVLIGEGDKFTKTSMRVLPTASFCCIPDNYPINFLIKEPALLQFHGMGPIEMKYMQPKDLPSPKK